MAQDGRDKGTLLCQEETLVVPDPQTWQGHWKSVSEFQGGREWLLRPNFVKHS